MLFDSSFIVGIVPRRLSDFLGQEASEGGNKQPVSSSRSTLNLLDRYSVRAAKLLLVIGVTDHPRNAKLIGQHAKVIPPESLVQGHGDLPAGRKPIE